MVQYPSLKRPNGARCTFLGRFPSNNMSRTLSRAKVGQTPRIPRFGLVSSPDLRFRQVVSNRRSYSQFNIRGLTASGWRGPTLDKPHHRPSMLDGLASHFVATAGCARLQQRRVFLRACRIARRPKRNLGSHPTISRRESDRSGKERL